MNMPKLSIITVNFNDFIGLSKTIKSLEEQSLCHKDLIEHIIVDGGSTDNSVDLIKEYSVRNHEYKIKWISEKDNGIYDGMNKGIHMSTGEYLYFLNGGDILHENDSLLKIINVINESDIIVGRVVYTYEGRSIGASKTLTEKDLSLYYMYLNGICHQATLIKRNLLEKYPYDITARINADWKFFIQTIILQNVSVYCTDIKFAEFDRTGLSSRNLDTLLLERREILKSLLPARVVTDYLEISPYYYDVIRVTWLVEHPILYKIYKTYTTICRKLLGND